MRKPNEFTRVLQLAAMLALPIGFVACAPEDGEELDTPETTLPEAETDMGAGDAEPMTVDIEGVGGANVQGEATISRVGESLMVSLTMEELPGEGPFRAQILSGMCRDDAMGGTDAMDEPVTTPDAGTGTPDATQPGTDMSGMQDGQVLATLEDIQVSGATGTTEGQAGMSHSTVSVTDLQGQTQAHIEILGQDNQAVACGNVNNLSQVLMGTGTGTGTTPMTPAPGTAPGTTDPATPGTGGGY